MSVTKGGELSVAGDVASPEKVSRLLRKNGGDPEKTEILLSIPDRSGPEDLSPAIAGLRAAGYSRIILVRPRRASASAESPASRERR